jgi:predicted Holliday junction resolvase-like endonuclease
MWVVVGLLITIVTGVLTTIQTDIWALEGKVERNALQISQDNVPDLKTRFDKLNERLDFKFDKLNDKLDNKFTLLDNKLDESIINQGKIIKELED